MTKWDELRGSTFSTQKNRDVPLVYEIMRTFKPLQNGHACTKTLGLLASSHVVAVGLVLKWIEFRRMDEFVWDKRNRGWMDSCSIIYIVERMVL